MMGKNEIISATNLYNDVCSIIDKDFGIWKSRFPNLTWTHVFKTFRVSDDTAIRWYQRQKQLFMLQHEMINMEDE